MVAKVREKLAVNIQAAKKFDVGRFNLRKLNELEVRKEYQIKISNRFAALDNLNDCEDINRAWENIKDNTKTSTEDSLGLYELKQHKLWFDEECLRFLDQRKPTKMQLLQDPSQSNLNNVRHETSRPFRNKEKEYLIAKIDGVEANRKIKKIGDLYIDINDVQKGYQPRTNIVKNEKVAVVTDFHSILAMRKNCFSHLFNVQVVSDVRQTEIHKQNH